MAGAVRTDSGATQTVEGVASTVLGPIVGFGTEKGVGNVASESSITPK